MSIEIKGLVTGIFSAGAAFTATNIGYGVRQNATADLQVSLCTPGQDCDGVLLEAAASGARCNIQHDGIAKLRAAVGGVTRGQIVTPTTTGFIAITAAYTNTSDGGSATDALIGGHAFAKALESAAAGELFSALIIKSGATPTTVTGIDS